MGSVVGLVGGSARRGQSHNSEVARLTSPSVGNLSEIIPRSMQAVRGEEYAVRGVHHVRDLTRLQSPSATVTGESDHHSSENTNSLVVRSLHSHGYGYEVLGTQSHLLGDSNADQAALTARVGHDRQGYCAGAFQEVKTQRFVIFALVGESEVDVRLRAGRAFRPLIANVIVQMVSEGECA